MKIIGISGPPCSGKDTAAEYLEVNYGFDKISTGDLLRQRAKELNVGLDRTSLQQLGAQLRKENDGNDPLLKQSIMEIKQNTVFTGLRTVNAALTIKELTGGNLWYIEASIHDRYSRSLIRARGDHNSFEEFLAQDNAEHVGAKAIDTSLLAIKGIATVIIANDGTLINFQNRIDETIREVL